MEAVTSELARDRTADVEDLFTPEEAAAYLKINEQTVRRFLREGVIRGYRIGRVWRIPHSALQEWLETMSNQRPGFQPAGDDAEE